MSYISFYFYFVPFGHSFLAYVVHTPRSYLEQLLSITAGDQDLILGSEGSDPIENLSSPARGPTQSITFKFKFHPYCFGNIWSLKHLSCISCQIKSTCGFHDAINTEDAYSYLQTKKNLKICTLCSLIASTHPNWASSSSPHTVPFAWSTSSTSLFEKVTGRKARGLQKEEMACKCQIFFLLKFCVATTTLVPPELT